MSRIMLAISKFGMGASCGGDPAKYELIKHTTGPAETIKLYNLLKEFFGVKSLEIVSIEADWLTITIPHMDRPIPDAAVEDEIWDYASFVAKPLEPLYKTIHEIFPTTLTVDQIKTMVADIVAKKFSLRIEDGKIRMLY